MASDTFSSVANCVPKMSEVRQNQFFSHFSPYISYKFRGNVWKKSKNLTFSDSLQSCCKVSYDLVRHVAKGSSPSGESSTRYPSTKFGKWGVFLWPKISIPHNSRNNRRIALKLGQRHLLVSGQLCAKNERSTSKSIFFSLFPIHSL